MIDYTDQTLRKELITTNDLTREWMHRFWFFHFFRLLRFFFLLFIIKWKFWEASQKRIWRLEQYMYLGALYSVFIHLHWFRLFHFQFLLDIAIGLVFGARSLK
jgi:hypothetical protein